MCQSKIDMNVRFPSRTLPRASHCLCQLVFFPHSAFQCRTFGHPHKKKNQTMPPSSIAPWSISHVHMPIVGTFSMRSDTMQPHAQSAAMHRVLIVDDHTQKLLFSNCATIALMWTSRVTLFSEWAMSTRDPIASSLLGQLLVGTDHCIRGTPYKTCCYGVSRSHHNLALVKVDQILARAHFS